MDVLEAGPDSFDVLNLIVTTFAIVVPVTITLILWRSDRSKREAEAKAARRGALYAAFGTMLAKLIDRKDGPEPPTDSELVGLIAGVSLHATAEDASAISWMVRRSRKVIKLVRHEISESGVRADVEEAAESAIEALATLGAWKENPSGVDLNSLDTDIDAGQAKDRQPVTAPVQRRFPRRRCTP